MQSAEATQRPDKPLELYDMEDCPFCRRVRAVMSELELDVYIYPCLRGGKRFRPRAVALGGRAMFPFFVDPNAGVQMYESADIMRYLVSTYGSGEPAAVPPLPAGVPLLTGIAAAFRRLRTRRIEPTTGPADPLELFGYESSPDCGVVRDVLYSLEVPYLLHNVVEGSSRWSELAERSGGEEVPYLIDPNTGVEKRGALEISDYLETAYGDG